MESRLSSENNSPLSSFDTLYDLNFSREMDVLFYHAGKGPTFWANKILIWTQNRAHKDRNGTCIHALKWIDQRWLPLCAFTRNRGSQTDTGTISFSSYSYSWSYNAGSKAASSPLRLSIFPQKYSPHKAERDRGATGLDTGTIWKELLL